MSEFPGEAVCIYKTCLPLKHLKTIIIIIPHQTHSRVEGDSRGSLRTRASTSGRSYVLAISLYTVAVSLLCFCHVAATSLSDRCSVVDKFLPCSCYMLRSLMTFTPGLPCSISWSNHAVGGFLLGRGRAQPSRSGFSIFFSAPSLPCRDAGQHRECMLR